MKRRQKRIINWTAAGAAAASVILLVLGDLRSGRWTPYYDQYRAHLVAAYFIAIVVLLVINLWNPSNPKRKPAKAGPARIAPQIGLRSTSQIVNYFGSLADKYERAAGQTAGSVPEPFLPQLKEYVGRDPEIDYLVDNMLIDPPTPTAVLGSQGMGKSTITIAAIRDRRVAGHFGPRRYFVRLDGARNVVELVSAIAATLDVHAPSDVRGAVFGSLAAEPATLVLDSFDAPWEHDRTAAERFLVDLVAAAPQTSITASIRGAEQPELMWWNAPIMLAPLADDAARSWFLHIAGEELASDPGLGELVSECAGVPLVVTSLAHAARGGLKPAAITQMCRSERDKVVALGWTDENRVRVAAACEAALGAPVLTAAARALLSVLAALPDGMAATDLSAAIADSPAGASESAAALRGASLVFDESDRIRMHPVLRECVLELHPPESGAFAVAVAHYLNLAKLGEQIGTPQGWDAVRRLTPDMLNIARVIEYALDHDDPRPAIEAACAMAEFSRCTGYGAVDLLGRAADRALEGPGDLARAALAYFRAGEVALQRAEYESAQKSYARALPQYRRLADVAGQANCISRIGDIAMFQLDVDAASKSYEDALQLYRKIDDALGEATSIKSLGDIAAERNDLPGARIHYDDALPIYRRIGDRLGEANCIKGLGSIEYRRRDHDAAREHYSKALPLYREVGDLLGEANCTMGLGDVARRLRDYKGAWLRYEEALPLFRQIGSVHGEANCIQSLGDIALRKRDRESAREKYGAALALFERIHEPYSIGVAHWRLSRLVTGGSEHLKAAREAWASIGRQDLIDEYLR